ncbi:uncharacterized protein LOC114760646 [Neltuma alba]|uniref:uncharacterized protein LOC114760646 n=1 Tax=Neltuma alba TaxID=207710 RepID=UPI0010A4E2BC|nr:uncharacterized protein LOC114760646 [Prosopis alba]
MASSGIATTLLPLGRIAHSRFVIPIDINEDSMCNISQSSPLSELIRCAKLIIWDEAPMVKPFCAKAVDRTFRDIMKCNRPFGGKCIVMGRDFKQILPVIPKDWLLDIGDGCIGLPHDRMTEIEVPDDFLIMDCHDPLQSIVKATYPDLLHHLANSEYLTNRAILTPTVEVVDQINDYVCSLLPGEPIEYFSSDSVSTADQGCTSFQELYTIEFLNTIKCSGLPPHRLVVKIEVPIMLVRNIDQAAELCNGTRLKITFLGK